MNGYDFERPFADASTFLEYLSIDEDTSSRFGRVVRAKVMSNAEYDIRYQRLSSTRQMRRPPSHLRIFQGYVVIRKLGTKDEYETWMPDHVFEEIYRER